jgi:phytoene synthase
VKFATGLYSRMLDRVETTNFDVLGAKSGVRVWHIPGAAVEALR